MVREIEGLSAGVIGFHVAGVVDREDYTKKFIPAIEEALQKHAEVNALVVIDADFDHYTWQAVLEDTKIGLMHPLVWGKIAIVTELEWMKKAVKYLRPFAPFKIKTYPSEALEDAKEWVQAQERHLKITLDKEKKILVLEPQGVLTKDDFSYLASMVDPYLAEEGKLKGLMIKTKNFPGWDSFSAMRGHLSFIKKHHEKRECSIICVNT